MRQMKLFVNSQLMEVIGQLYSVELVEFRNKFTQKDFTSGTVLQIQMYLKVYAQESAEVLITVGVTTSIRETLW